MDTDKTDNGEISQEIKQDDSVVDEDMNLFIYGNILIRDIDTGEVLVNKRF